MMASKDGGNRGQRRAVRSSDILFQGLFTVTQSTTWMCLICGWIYEESAGCPEHGLPPGTAWQSVPLNWTCPECGARKEDFEMVQI